jgi:hypothetical protein
VRWPIASNNGAQRSRCAAAPAATTNSCAASAAAGRPKTGAETKPPAPASAAVGTEGHRRQRIVVGEHRHHHLALRRIPRAGGQRRARGDQRTGLVGRAVPHRDLVSGGDEVLRHGSAHPAEPDETDLHRPSSIYAAKAAA